MSVNNGTGHDPVNHPKHYVVGGFECLDVIEALGLDRNYHVANAFKYIWRHGRKGSNEIEDIEKAIFYLSRWVEMQGYGNE